MNEKKSFWTTLREWSMYLSGISLFAVPRSQDLEIGMNGCFIQTNSFYRGHLRCCDTFKSTRPYLTAISV